MDPSLLGKARGGDVVALEQILKNFNPLVLSTAKRLRWDKSDVEA